ncbi:MAG: hypothetical protein JNN30_18245 [Rhodanobacteraceae bacterium]|nr:hypothetical protein [Rhodanobacteraceae bacterium]
MSNGMSFEKATRVAEDAFASVRLFQSNHSSGDQFQDHLAKVIEMLRAEGASGGWASMLLAVADGMEQANTGGYVSQAKAA